MIWTRIEIHQINPMLHPVNGVARTLKKSPHIKGRLLYQSVILFNRVASFFKWELLLKGRICSQRERIVSFKSSSLWYDKSLLPHWVTSLECYFFSTHVRQCLCPIGRRELLTRNHASMCMSVHKRMIIKQLGCH